LSTAIISHAVAADPILFAKPDAFQTLINPNCSHCIDESKSRAGDLRADDPVLAWIRGKYDGGAIPIRFFLNPFRVISDTYGVFVFDPDAGFARGYGPSLDFRFFGWRNGVMVMRHTDGTLFSTLSGVAFDGPRKGEQLKPIATLRTDWGHWQKAYPGSVAYRMFEKYQPVELPERHNSDSHRTRAAVDGRLAENADVLGVSMDGKRKAYLLDAMPEGGGIVRDSIADTQIAIFWQPDTHTAVAYATSLDGAHGAEVKRLAFDRADPDAPFVDRETNSRFGIEGRAVSGPLKGKTLTWIDSVQCRWFAWVAEYPQTEIYEPAPAPQPPACGNARPASPVSGGKEMVLTECGRVTPAAADGWRREGFVAAVLPLNEDHSPAAYARAAASIAAAGLDLYYWIEIARNQRLADAHPRWMAALGMHDDWLARFPALKKPSKDEVAKAYPWVPIGYSEAFQAHLQRVRRLLAAVPPQYRGILLNDLQGGPASCGCGNLQCRWALDYQVSATAQKENVDDAAARFLAAVKVLAPGKQIVPVWMTECEDGDLPADKAPDGKSTGLCGSVGCATSTCPRVFAKQLAALLDAHAGPLGLLVCEEDAGRDAKHYGGPGGWVAASVKYLDGTRLGSQKRVPPHDNLWLVVQGTPEPSSAETAARRAANGLHAGAVIVARTKIDQSYEPRSIAIEPAGE
jgi:hypothetical protein